MVSVRFARTMSIATAHIQRNMIGASTADVPIGIQLITICSNLLCKSKPVVPSSEDRLTSTKVSMIFMEKKYFQQKKTGKSARFVMFPPNHSNYCKISCSQIENQTMRQLTHMDTVRTAANKIECRTCAPADIHLRRNAVEIFAQTSAKRNTWFIHQTVSRHCRCRAYWLPTCDYKLRTRRTTNNNHHVVVVEEYNANCLILSSDGRCVVYGMRNN